ncbi:MAG: hypothetical protein PHP02_05695 [Eubacteriales bacterium]|nr:hypothetical protein [Eubacteriales bacterium]
MSDHFREEVVTRRNRSRETLVYVLANIVMAVSGIYALFMINLLISVISMNGFSAQMLLEILLVLLMAAIAVVLFLYRDRIRTEYEYTFTNGIMDFAQVYNNRKRKALGSMNVRNVEACGMVPSGAFNRYLSVPDVKKRNWFLNRDAELFFFFFVKDGKKSLMILEPSGEMISLIKRYVGAGKFQTN